MSAAPKLTAAVRKTIISYIRQGGFPHMAAEAAGVPVAAFDAWMSRANRPGCPKNIRAFAAEVRNAQAVARVLAEVEVFKSDPKAWLKSGPGRDQADSPGWTTSSPPARRTEKEVDLLADPAWAELWATVLRAVSAFPEARAALADVLKAFDSTGKKTS